MMQFFVVNTEILVHCENWTCPQIHHVSDSVCRKVILCTGGGKMTVGELGYPQVALVFEGNGKTLLSISGDYDTAILPQIRHAKTIDLFLTHLQIYRSIHAFNFQLFNIP